MNISRLLIASFLLAPLFGQAQASWQWGSIGGSTASYIPPNPNPIDEWPQSMAIDKKGNTYAIVKGVDKIHVGNLASSFTGDAYSIVSWSCDGQVRWIKTIGPSFAGKIATDTLGGVYFTGRMHLMTGNYFDNDYSIPPQSDHKWNYIAKYDTAGHFQWVKFPDPNLNISDFNNWPYYMHLQAAPNGDLSVLAYLPPGTHANGAYTVTDTSYQVLKFNSSGQFTGAVPLPMKPYFDINGAPYQSVLEASTFLKDEKNGTYYIAGTAYGPAAYANFSINNLPVSSDVLGMYAAAFNGTGQLKWLKQQPVGSFSSIYDATLDQDGRLYLCGQALAGKLWNGDTFKASGNAPNVAYVVCMETNGTNKWVSTGHSLQTETAMANSIAINSNGTIAAVGHIFNTFKWNNYTISQNPPPGQTNSMTGLYLATLDPQTGACTGMDSLRIKYGHSNAITPQFMLPDNRGNLYISGAFSNPSTSSVDTFTVIGNSTMIPIGGTSDFFMAKYGQSNCNTLLGVNTLPHQDDLLIYPNPATTEIFVNAPAEGKAMLYDVQGRLLFTTTLKAGANRLALPAGIPAGVYVLSVAVKGEAQGVMRKLVIQK